MPTLEQLSHISVVDGDGASVVNDEDGSVTTSWPDGTVRVDETDGRSMVTFSDYSVLNIEADKTVTLTDVNGKPLDTTTGEPLGEPADTSIPTPPPTTVQELKEFVEGASSISDLAGAKGILRGFAVAGVVDKQYSAISELAFAFKDALEEDMSPASWFIQPIKMLLEVINALQTPERGAGMRSWCYTVTYDAMGMGLPPEPTFANNLLGPDQDALNQKWWDDSRAEASTQLADGQNGTALRNRVLLLIAKCNGDPASAVTELWAEACRKSGDDGNAGLLASYSQLSWPDPTGD